MQKLLYEIIAKRDKILKIAKKWGVENVRIFGSVASGTETKNSDIDLLVDLTKGYKGNKCRDMDFAFEVGKLFKKRRVECCTPEGLVPRIGKNIMANNISIMEDNPKFLKKVEKDYLANVELSIDWINNYNKFYKKYTQKDILENELLLNAFRSMVQRPLEEMVRYIPCSIKERIATGTNWDEMRKFRNVIVHNYRIIGREGMWDRAKEKMKKLEIGTMQLYKYLKEKEEKQNK